MKKHWIEISFSFILSALFLWCLAFFSGCDYPNYADYKDYKVKFMDGAMKGSVKIEMMKDGYAVGDTAYITNSNAVVVKKF